MTDEDRKLHSVFDDDLNLEAPLSARGIPGQHSTTRGGRAAGADREPIEVPFADLPWVNARTSLSKPDLRTASPTPKKPALHRGKYHIPDAAARPPILGETALRELRESDARKREVVDPDARWLHARDDDNMSLHELGKLSSLKRYPAQDSAYDAGSSSAFSGRRPAVDRYEVFKPPGMKDEGPSSPRSMAAKALFDDSPALMQQMEQQRNDDLERWLKVATRCVPSFTPSMAKVCRAASNDSSSDDEDSDAPRSTTLGKSRSRSSSLGQSDLLQSEKDLGVLAKGNISRTNRDRNHPTVLFSEESEKQHQKELSKQLEQQGGHPTLDWLDKVSIPFSKKLHARPVAMGASEAIGKVAGVAMLERRPLVKPPIPLQTIPNAYAHTEISSTATTYHHKANLFGATFGANTTVDLFHPSLDPTIKEDQMKSWMDRFACDAPSHRYHGRFPDAATDQDPFLANPWDLNHISVHDHDVGAASRSTTVHFETLL